MSGTGVYDLGDFTITGAGTVVGTAVTGLDGVLGLNVQARLAYGSGGTDARLYIQTSLDQGTTWIDIACVLFGVASENKILNFSGLTPKLTQMAPTDGSLGDDTAVDGVLGDRFRCKIISIGTYSGSTVLSVRLVAR